MIATSAPVTIWDLPTRLCHWSLPVLIAGLWYTGTESNMDWHLPLAYCLLGVVLFRLVWGWIGSYHSRFKNFPLAPKKTLTYLQGERNYHGHNPLGSWSVIALISLMLTQLGTGLFANDAVFTEGPLAQFISTDLSDTLTEWHKLLFNGLLAMIGIHLAAVFWHSVVLREDLIKTMIKGKRQMVVKAPYDVAPLRRAFIVALSIGVIIWLMSYFL